MSRRNHISARLALVAALLPLGAFAEDRYLVKATGDIQGIANRHNLTLVKSLSGSAAGYYVLSSRGPLPQSVLSALAQETAVKSAESEKPVPLPGLRSRQTVKPAATNPGSIRISSFPTFYYTSFAVTGYTDQPATNVINMDAAHILATGSNVVVALIDTGVDFAHPVLQRSLIPGWDFVSTSSGGQEVAQLNQETTPILDVGGCSDPNNPDPNAPGCEQLVDIDQETTPILDGGTTAVLNQEVTPILDLVAKPVVDSRRYPAFGHGTMVAGLIHLVAPKATILPIRTFGADGRATVSQIVDAIYYAIAHHADVINMSFSMTLDSPAVSAALETAKDAGIILVASAGNDGLPEQVYPAAYPTVIGVAGTNNFMSRSLWSNYGTPLVSLAAPDEGVITTYPMQHYAQVNGTSFSSPMVAGAAALMVEVNRRITPAKAASVLAGTAHRVDPSLGAGELDLLRACLGAR